MCILCLFCRELFAQRWCLCLFGCFRLLLTTWAFLIGFLLLFLELRYLYRIWVQ